MEKPVKTLTLCPACGECPKVEIFGDRVRIGEDENTVILGIPEWNQLVDAILSGKLDRIE